MTTNTTTYRLCGFSDASLRAYAAVIYLEVEQEDSSELYLLCSKAKVSPVGELIIPQLELLSALILASLVDRVSEALLPLEPFVCYLNSKVAYYWITWQDRSWKPFVQNRVAEIRRVPVHGWKHCAGQLNPVDVPSCGQSMSEFLRNPWCFSRPKKSLQDSQSTWNQAMEMPQGCESETSCVLAIEGGDRGADPTR